MGVRCVLPKVFTVSPRPGVRLMMCLQVHIITKPQINLSDPRSRDILPHLPNGCSTLNCTLFWTYHQDLSFLHTWGISVLSPNRYQNTAEVLWRSQCNPYFFLHLLVTETGRITIPLFAEKVTPFRNSP